MQSVLSWTLNILYALAGLAFLPTIIYRFATAGRYRHGWGSRFGAVPRRLGGRPVIWIHAVSMGEVNAIRTLVPMLRQQLPYFEVMISTTTDTGYSRAVSLFGLDHVFFFPFDLSFVMRRAFERLRPAMVLLVELEVWPNLLIEAKRRGVPIAVINGRVTQRSLKRYRWTGPLGRWLFGQLDRAMVQDDAYRERFAQLGVPLANLQTTGSLKWDSAVTDEAGLDEESLSKAAAAVGLYRDRPILVAGSTVETVEEEAILRAYRQLKVHHADLQLVIAPRKPERFDQVAKLIQSRGLKVIRRSTHPDGEKVSTPSGLANSRVVLLDTMGELRRFYALATVVIVGRTFVDYGGSDVMEIAAVGKAMVMGPSIYNFADAADKLIEGEGAIQLASVEKIASTIDRLLSNRNELDAIATRARQVVDAQQGATEQTTRTICELLGHEFDASGRSAAALKVDALAR